jgi:hypothetical protein
MNRNISDTIPMGDAIPVYGEWEVTVTRWDGKVERKRLINTVTVPGLNRIASCAVNSAAGVFNALAIGTATAAPALTDSQSSLGEVGRKASIGLGASAQSREWIFLTATWGGSADGITSVALDSAGITIGTSSLATALLANRVNGMGVTLANSDLLNLTARIRVGSHDVAHST